ncbi:MAG: Ig-like domain-containing protein [Firmicutes bacterium]|nr:Ig-like domain-containing protein [Bacillota bacterium]
MPVPVSGIRISGFSHNIAAGKKIALKAEISPANAQDTRLIWSSSNPKVATVNTNGVVTMKKCSGGKKVTIKAAAADGSGVFASYRITSMKGVVKKISISGKKTVKAGKSIKLKTKVSATKKANKTLLWSSSNEKLATVKNGKVTEKKNAKGKKLGSQPLPQTAAEKRKPSPSRFSDPSTLI